MDGVSSSLTRAFTRAIPHNMVGNLSACMLMILFIFAQTLKFTQKCFNSAISCFPPLARVSSIGFSICVSPVTARPAHFLSTRPALFSIILIPLPQKPQTKLFPRQWTQIGPMAANPPQLMRLKFLDTAPNAALSCILPNALVLILRLQFTDYAVTCITQMITVSLLFIVLIPISKIPLISAFNSSTPQALSILKPTLMRRSALKTSTSNAAKQGMFAILGVDRLIGHPISSQSLLFHPVSPNS